MKKYDERIHELLCELIARIDARFNATHELDLINDAYTIKLMRVRVRCVMMIKFINALITND